MQAPRLSVLMSSVALVLLAVGARPASAAVTVDRESTIGKQVSTFFFSVTKTVHCGPHNDKTATVSGQIAGAESVSRTTGQPVTRTNGLTVDVFGFDNGCTAGPSSGFGGVANGLVGPGPLLALATMNGSGSIQDFDSGATIPFTVHLTVVASGPLTSSGATTETHTANGPGGPFTITIQRTANSNRNGTVSGTFTLGGVTFDLGGQSATLLSNSNATITVTRP